MPTSDSPLDRLWSAVAIAFLLGWTWQHGWLPESRELFVEDDPARSPYLLREAWGHHE